MHDRMSAALEPSLPRKRDNEREALARSSVPPELDELHAQIRLVRQLLGGLEDQRNRRQRRQSRVENLRTELAVAEEHSTEARAAASETASVLAGWLLQRGDPPRGS